MSDLGSPVPSRRSVVGKVFDNGHDARKHGPGGIWYVWKSDVPGKDRKFPEDVYSVMIVMPVQWGELGRDGISCEWTVARKNSQGAQWTLSGTKEEPTLSPSLHWVGMWHGYLRSGRLDSC